MAQSDIEMTPSSGNVFADLGFAEPEEELARAQLAIRIQQTIKRRRLTQVAAAKLMGIDQPKALALLDGRLSSFSIARLVRLLTALGHDVEIVVKTTLRRPAIDAAFSRAETASSPQPRNAGSKRSGEA